MKRGILADPEILINHLQSINYYRLSGYLHPFREENATDRYRTGTTINQALRVYDFDSKLRALVLEAVDRIEITVKTQIAYFFSLKYDPFGYIEPATLPEMEANKHKIFLRKIRNDLEKSQEVFVRHFKEKYGKNHKYLPIWMAVEIMTFGQTLALFNGLEPKIKREVAQNFKVPIPILQSWLLALNTVRNICAHHARLWNRILGNKPRIPKKQKYPQWHSPVKIQNDKIFCILMIIKYILNIINPHNKWGFRLQSLLDRYDKIPLREMGFPENWEQCPIWLAPHND